MAATGGSLVSHDEISGHDLDHYRRVFKTFRPKQGQDNFVPVATFTMGNEIYTVIELVVLLMYVFALVGKIVYLKKGYMTKFTDLFDSIRLFKKLGEKATKKKGAMRWFFQSLMEYGPATIVCECCMILMYTIGTLIKITYIKIHITPLTTKILLKYPSSTSNAYDIGSYVVPENALSGPAQTNNMIHLISAMELREDTVKREFINNGGAALFYKTYVAATVISALGLALYIVAMHFHRKDIARLYHIGCLHLTSTPTESAELKLAEVETSGKKSLGSVLLEWLRGTQGYKGLNDDDYDVSDEEDETDFEKKAKGTVQVDKSSAIQGELQSSRDSGKPPLHELVNYTRLSRTYATIMFYISEPAFYGVGTALLIDLLDNIYVLMVGRSVTDATIGLHTTVHAEVVLCGFLAAIAVCCICFCVVDGYIYGSNSMIIVYLMFLTVEFGNLVKFNPQHIGAIYVYVVGSVSLAVCIICFMIHIFVNSEEFTRRMRNDVFFYIKRKGQRMAGLTQSRFKTD